MVEQRVISRETGLEDTQYKWGFELDIESEVAPRGLSEDIVRLISAKMNEPEWMLDWRLKAYRHWLKLGAEEPRWANVDFSPIDYRDIIYYAAPRSQSDGPKSLDEVDPEILEGFDKLGIPLEEQKRLTGVAVDAVLDVGREGATISRYKGLAEMDAEELWQTTMNPETRTLLRVTLDDAVEADRIFTILMGDNVAARNDFIQRNALLVNNLDLH